jgi:hypothetical protein
MFPQKVGSQQEYTGTHPRWQQTFPVYVSNYKDRKCSTENHLVYMKYA